MNFSKIDIQKVEQASDIRDIIPNLQGRGSTLYCKCPQCGESRKHKGLAVTHKSSAGKVTNIAKCFKCGYAIAGSIKAVETFQGLSFVEAVEFLAKKYNVQLSGDKPSPKKKSAEAASIEGSFCEMQLHDSGLTVDDVMVKVPVPGSDEFKLVPAFQKGGADNLVQHFNSSDDEMLIYYHDLEGNQMYYNDKRRPSSKPRPYIRVRWSNPFAHSFEEGKEVKYQTPKGAPCAFYIPQYIRDRYRTGEVIETLVIQEGEKKAEKACKHDIPSLGIQGIYNIGNAETGLLKELQYIVQKCKVKKIVLLMDSDWDQLSRNLKPDDHIDARPNQFSKAVIKFRDYVMTLHKMSLHVDIYFGHINANETGAKGIDDLLVRSLYLKEHELKEDMDDAINSHNGVGKYVSIHKVTTKTDNQIRDYWKLNSAKEFFAKYRDRINELITFRFGYISYIIEDGEIKEAARNAAKSNFWDVEINEKEKKSITFNYKSALDFLKANFFHKIHTIDLKRGEYKLVKIEDNVVCETSAPEIRDFVYRYVERSTKDEDVLNFFISRIENLLGAGKLERLTEINDDFNEPEPMVQHYFYRGKALKITADDIEEEQLAIRVWEDNLIKRNFKRVKIIDFINKYEDGTFGINFTEEGLKSEFLQYLICASNFWKDKENTMSEEDQYVMGIHLINKITALGYLLNSWKPRSEQVAVVAMDAKMGEVGESNGRSGKSLLGQALEKIINVCTIDCKKQGADDEFIYSLVTPKTRVVFLDDTKVNFDFRNFYSALTGNLQINPKQGARFEIKYDKAPKFLITTNHALNDQSDSGKDRRVMLSFARYFSTNYPPSAHFGHQLFDDWDDYQWNLFDNLMMECVMYYLRSMKLGWTRQGRGIVPPPMDQLERRAMRQIMGETFLQWAEAFFDLNSGNINRRIPRKELSDKYHSEFPGAKQSISAQYFREKMKAYCRFKGYHFNPNGRNEEGEAFSEWRQAHSGESFEGTSYKSNSIEYWMIATDEFSKEQPW